MSQQESLTSIESSESSLQGAKLQIQKGDLGAAIAILKELIVDKPSHRDGLYYLAVCYRKQNDNDQALATLSTLLGLHPHYGRAYQELGHNQNYLKDPDSASIAFEKAVSLNPALIASWKALVLHYDSVGDKERALEAMQHAQWLKQLPPELLSVSSLINEDKLAVAEKICRQFLQKKPHHMEAMRLLAEIGSKHQILDDAEFLLESCVEFYPDYARARLDYVRVLHRRQKFEKALEQAEKLYQSDPGNIAYEIALASENQAVGNFDQALEIFDKVIQRDGTIPSVYSARGHALKTIGRTDEAIKSYQKAYENKADYGDAYWSLANLKTYSFSDTEIRVMKDQESSDSIAIGDQVHLCFALGKALEDRAEYLESFTYYERGNKLKRSQSNYTPARLEQEFATQEELFDSNFFAARSHFGAKSGEPIFIVGLPRAGSTLLEQILASHSHVDGTMELANVIGLAHRLAGRNRNKEGAKYPAILEELDDESFKKYGEQFIEETQIHRGKGVYFIDKMPNNFRHIPLIHLMLPNAKIIDARRHPMSCCFSGFKQLFAEGQEFTYGLSDIGRYYRSYVDLMNHWEEVLPGRILKVQHEDVIEDLEGQVRIILDHCGLPFEQGCVDFHKTERAVRTPSSEQVRQPIFKSSMEQWRNYEAHLQPLIDALGPSLENY